MTMKLTALEYGVLMQALNNAKSEMVDGTFFDPYNNEENLTEEQVAQALETVEDKLIAQGFDDTKSVN